MYEEKSDLSTLFGIFGAFALVGVAIMFSGSLGAYFDLPAVLIVVGGTCAVTLASFGFKDVLRMPGMVFRSIFTRAYDPKHVATSLLDIAEIGRKKGVLAMQEEAVQHADIPFLAKGLQMVADAVELREIERVLRQEIYSVSERHMVGASILRKMAETSPAMGLIGTLIGLVQMLGNLDDSSKIGPAMAVALITTLYGAMLSYMLFSPLASKLEHNSAEEILIKTLFVHTVISIGRQENPRKLEMLLNTILPPAARVHYFNG